MKKAYLTIDDGPSAGRRRKVDVLTKYGIQAVWFCMGQDMEQRPEDAIYTIEHGGIIGNHSYSHPNFSQISLEQAYEEIQRTDEMVDEMYRIAGKKRPMKVFRFPYGNKGAEKAFYDYSYTEDEKMRVDAIQAFLCRLGYTSLSFDDITYQYYENLRRLHHVDWYWTYDAMEWCVFQEKTPYGIKTLDDVIDLMDLDLPERWMGLNYEASSEIVVIHDHPQTTEYFETIIKALIQKGLEFQTYLA